MILGPWLAFAFLGLQMVLVRGRDDSVCFNDCSGHGECIDYTCYCVPGYTGDDCGTTFAPEEGEELIPILHAGHLNVTSKKELSGLLKKQSSDVAAVVLGFSSPNCHRCIVVENEYDAMLKQIDRDEGIAVTNYGKNGKASTTRHKILLGRVDVMGSDSMKEIAQDFGINEIPAIVVFPTIKGATKKEKKGILYSGHHSHRSIQKFVTKVLSPPAVRLNDLTAVEYFLVHRGHDSMNTGDDEAQEEGLDAVNAQRASSVVGFFSSPQDMEEDEYEEFIEVAQALRERDDLHFGVVTDKKVIKAFKATKIIDRSPSIVLYTPSASVLDASNHKKRSKSKDKSQGGVAPDGSRSYKATNLDELFAEGANRGGVQSWIVHNTVPLVGKLTNSNFHLYSQIQKPMLMLFLDLQREQYITNDSEGSFISIGGKTGGIHNQNLLNEFTEVAKEHAERFSFVYLDGTKHEDQMRNLGLYGGAARLPSVAFNTRDNIQAPFPEELPINKDALLTYCAAMISGKLRNSDDSKEMARKALQSVTPVNPKNRASRKEVNAPPEPVKGVLEHFDDGSVGDRAVLKLTAATIEEAVFDTYEDKDVLLMLHAHSGLCEQCGHFAVYFKKLAERFAELGLDSLVVARIDVSTESPPASLKLIGEASLPTMVMLSAGAKQPPWQFYSGVGKVGPMMKWTHQQAGIPFNLPNLPHLTEEQKGLYKEQVRERERIRTEREREDEEAMAALDRTRSELKQRRKQEELMEAEVEVDTDAEEEWIDAGEERKKEPYEKDPALELLMESMKEELDDATRQGGAATEDGYRDVDRDTLRLEEEEFERKLREQREVRMKRERRENAREEVVENDAHDDRENEDEEEDEDEDVKEYKF